MPRGIFKEEDDLDKDLFDPFDKDNEMRESLRMFVEELKEITETYLTPWLK